MADEEKDLKAALDRLNETALQKVVDAKSGRAHQKIRFAIMDTDEEGRFAKSVEDPEPLAGTTLAKSVVNTKEDLKRGKHVQRLTFQEDPTAINFYQALWKPKPPNLYPDHILKLVSHRDNLVSAIVATRSNQISAFGRELQDRFATGFRIEPRPGVMEDASNDQKEALQKRIEDASKILGMCGSLEGVKFDERMSFSIYLGLQTRQALVFGRFATEIVYTTDMDGGKKFHSFRPSDVGTIYQASKRHDSVESVRKQAYYLLQQLAGNQEKLRPEKFENDEYAWVQVIEGKPRQAFTPEEILVHNVFPVTDIEMRDYPVSPIETVIDGIATHMNIVQHNKLYFQSGRAARGMIVIKSQDVDQGLVAQIRQHFNASINNVSNAWRVPVFGVDPEDEVTWAPFDMTGGRDMEFQYLSDQNAREICSAFQISPEELPGYQHLSRGTNSQALSESSNEYKLEAARDVGIRPLLNMFQDFINDHLLPLIDPAVAQLCTLKLYGLDADTEEKEDTNITNRMPIDLTLDEILERKEKDPVGKEWGGQFIFNPSWQAILDKYIKVSAIKEHFFGVKADEDDAYVRDPFWFQYQQLKQQAQQMEQQAQAQQQQAAQPQQPEEGGAPQGGDDQGGGDDSGGSEGGSQEKPQSELATGADQAMDMMSKSEAQLPPNKRRLLALHKKIVKDAMDSWEKDSEEALAEIVNAVKEHK